LNVPAKIILIGLDSADRNLILKWCKSGDLPNLGAMQDRGRWGVLTSEPAMGDDATWASFYTTVSCAKHGRFYFKAVELGSYRTPRFREHHLRYEPFWADLSRTGNRVAIIDVPKCPLVRDLNGMQVTDWLVHGRDYETRSWPSNIALDILQRYGDDYTDRWGPGSWLCGRDRLQDNMYEIFVQRTLQSIQKKLLVAEEILDRGDWSLFTVVFKESHCIGHQFWHLLDETHERYNANMAKRLENPIKRVYMALDSAVGKLLQCVSRDTTVIVFSGLGMGNNYTGEHILDEILRRLERSDATLAEKIYCTITNLADKVCSQLVRVDSNYQKKRIRRYFQLEHNEISGAIRINLVGREPRGRISRGREMDALCEWLREELLDIVDPVTGEPIAANVLRTDSFFTGEGLDLLPDLFVIWHRQTPIVGANSPAIGELNNCMHSFRTGNHVANGFYFIMGPQIIQAKQPCEASIMDIGPTVASLLGTKLKNTDGKQFSFLTGK
jgi:predicted AlkP superfamily phosphohydrolase/phosphomutase